MFEIEKYIKENGECPVDSFVKDLLNDGQKMLVTKMLHYINILEQIGFDIVINDKPTDFKLDKNTHDNIMQKFTKVM